MRYDHRTRDYVARRTAEGMSTKDIMRCLKRFVAREVYRHLRTTHSLDTQARPEPNHDADRLPPASSRSNDAAAVSRSTNAVKSVASGSSVSPSTSNHVTDGSPSWPHDR